MFLPISFTGQSNMSGPRPTPATFPIYANAARIESFGYFSLEWGPAVEPLMPANGETPAAGASPAMPCADKLVELLDANPKLGWTPGVSKVGIILTAVGGTSSAMWAPTWLTGEANPTAQLYGKDLRRIRLAEQAKGWPVAAWVDYQVESDAVDTSMVGPFTVNKRNQVHGKRLDLGRPNLPTILTRPGPDPALAVPPNLNFPAWTYIQSAMDRIVDVAPHRVKVVSASDLEAGYEGNAVHLTIPSIVTLGERYADALYQMW